MRHNINHQTCQPDTCHAHLTEAGADAVVAASLAGDLVPVLQTLPGHGTINALHQASLRAGMDLRCAEPDVVDCSGARLPMLVDGRDGFYRPATLAEGMQSLAVGEEHILVIEQLDRADGTFTEHVRQTLEEQGTRGVVVLADDPGPVVAALGERTVLVEAEQMRTADQVLAGCQDPTPGFEQDTRP